MKKEAANSLLDIVKKRQVELGWNNSELSRRAGVSYNQVRFWLNGRAKDPAYPAVRAILNVLDIGEPEVTIPVFGDVPAGNPMTIDEINRNECEVLTLPTARPDWFALKVRGSSMNRIAPEGSFVICRPGPFDVTTLDGKMVIANCEGECTFKRLKLNPLRLEPRSYDDTFESIFPKPHELVVLAEVMMIFIDVR